jgi:hypothetical protein
MNATITTAGLCKHSLAEHACNFCNGVYDKLTKQEKERKEERGMDWSTILQSATHFNEPWSLDDSIELYKHLSGFTEEKSWRFKMAVRSVCKILGRTPRSIKFHFYYMFLDVNEIKRNEWHHREIIEKENKDGRRLMGS